MAVSIGEVADKAGGLSQEGTTLSSRATSVLLIDCEAMEWLKQQL